MRGNNFTMQLYFTCSIKHKNQIITKKLLYGRRNQINKIHDPLSLPHSLNPTKNILIVIFLWITWIVLPSLVRCPAWCFSHKASSFSQLTAPVLIPLSFKVAASFRYLSLKASDSLSLGEWKNISLWMTQSEVILGWEWERVSERERVTEEERKR